MSRAAPASCRAASNCDAASIGAIAHRRRLPSWAGVGVAAAGCGTEAASQATATMCNARSSRTRSHGQQPTRGASVKAAANGSTDGAAAAHAAAAAAAAGRDGQREVAVLGGEDFILSQRSGVEELLFKGERLGVDADMVSVVFWLDCRWVLLHSRPICPNSQQLLLFPLAQLTTGGGRRLPPVAPAQPGPPASRAAGATTLPGGEGVRGG